MPNFEKAAPQEPVGSEGVAEDTGETLLVGGEPQKLDRETVAALKKALAQPPVGTEEMFPVQEER